MLLPKVQQQKTKYFYMSVCSVVFSYVDHNNRKSTHCSKLRKMMTKWSESLKNLTTAAHMFCDIWENQCLLANLALNIKYIRRKRQNSDIRKWPQLLFKDHHANFLWKISQFQESLFWVLMLYYILYVRYLWKQIKTNCSR